MAEKNNEKTGVNPETEPVKKEKFLSKAKRRIDDGITDVKLFTKRNGKKIAKTAAFVGGVAVAAFAADKLGFDPSKLFNRNNSDDGIGEIDEPVESEDSPAMETEE